MTDLLAKMNRYLKEADVPEWMSKGKTTLIQKTAKKEPPPTIIDL